MRKIIFSSFCLLVYSLAHAACGVSFFFYITASEITSGSGVQHAVSVAWKTNSESNTLAYYVVERAYNSGTSFTKIGTMAKQGGAGDNYYTFTDNYPCFGNGQHLGLFYRVRMVTIDNNSCYSSIAFLSSLSDCPSSPSQSDCGIASIEGPTQICSTNAFYEPVYTSSYISYSMTPSNIVTVSASNSLLTLTRNGSSSGVVTLTASTGSCGTITKTVYVGAGDPPGLTATYDANCGTYLQGTYSYNNPITTGFTWYLTDAATSTTTTYTTSLSTGGNLLLQPFLNNPAQGSTYSYYLTVAGSTSCGTTAASYYVAPINIGPVSDCGDGGPINRRIPAAPTTASLIQPHGNVQLYPNPARNLVMIGLPDTINLTQAVMKVFDMYGRLVRTIARPSYSNSIPLDGFAPGVYLVEIFINRKQVLTRKFVKQ